MKRVVILTEEELNNLKRTTREVSIELNLLLKYMRANMEKQDMGINNYGIERLYATIETQTNLIDEAREILCYSQEI